MNSYLISSVPALFAQQAAWEGHLSGSIDPLHTPIEAWEVPLPEALRRSRPAEVLSFAGALYRTAAERPPRSLPQNLLSAPYRRVLRGDEYYLIDWR